MFHFFKRQEKKYEIRTEKQVSELFSLQPIIDKVICEIVKSIDNQNDDNSFKLYHELTDKILSYGTNDTTKIIKYIQHKIACASDDNVSMESGELIALLVILNFQLKYDITGIKSSPALWFLGKFTTNNILVDSKAVPYNKEKSYLENEFIIINKFVKKLKLKKFLKIPIKRTLRLWT